MLSCANVTLSVPGKVLCRDLAVEFAPGEVWAVLGRNGSGKSTLIHALAGLTLPSSGAVQLDGVALAQTDPRTRARSVGVLLQIEEGTYWGTVAEYVLLGRYPHAAAWTGYSREDVEAADTALAAVGMVEFAPRRFATLSGGERQRVRIAQILAQSPRILLLDEPLQHLDLAHQAHTVTLIAQRARDRHETALMVLHEPLWIGRACTHALILNGDGGATAGAADDVLTCERLEQAYGCRLREVVHAEGRSFVPAV